MRNGPYLFQSHITRLKNSHRPVEQDEINLGFINSQSVVVSGGDDGG